MNLGAFSISLAVKDLTASMAFYGKLGFEVIGGNPDDHYVILRNGQHVIGLFQGMFEQNILTFNPGWNQEGNPVEPFTDVRDLQKDLREKGVTFFEEADEDTSGPASFVVVDPDGNPVLVDQHV
jgi:catechol 2,3-dioxygenase-like lactoylglutathione lyase family enzyme